MRMAERQQWPLFADAALPYPDHATRGKPFGPTIAVEKDTTMKNFINSMREAARKQALYVRTRNEIAAMPRDVALDLGIFPEDAERIARKAVWG
jgi:uncharacterized protein YjiS (DUF1127 family)